MRFDELSQTGIIVDINFIFTCEPSISSICFQRAIHLLATINWDNDVELNSYFHNRWW